MKRRLPNKLSKLIEVALDDLDKCEQDPKYKVDMDAWHLPNSHCSVCFAGTVMAKSLNTDRSYDVDGYDEKFTDSQWDKFMALDQARCGFWVSAIWEIPVNRGEPYVEISDKIEALPLPTGTNLPEYSTDKKKFKDMMVLAAGILAAEGY